MVLLSLLDLPLTLPPDAEARKHGFETFTSGLSDYLSRCKWYLSLVYLTGVLIGRS